MTVLPPRPVGRNIYRAKSAKEALHLVRLLTRLGDQEITCTNVGHGTHIVEWTRTPESAKNALTRLYQL